MSRKRPGPVVLDIEGLVLNERDRRRIGHPLTGGVILFSRNIASRAQLIELTTAIRDVRDDVLICIDHEGGRVQRFKTDGLTHLPAMRRLGVLWNDDALSATQLATDCGYVLAAELRACGVDFSFTPVLDLDYGTSVVIGDRAFHADARVVTLLAKSLNHGLLLAGMHNCGKHFPGHGFVEADSHTAIPVDERPLEAILTADAAPYGWLALGLSSVMPAHVIYPQVDALPAGFSTMWLRRILRQQLRFDGVIFSDDLSMEGASVAGDVSSAAQLALTAGCDMVLICNSPAKADQLLQSLSFDPKMTSAKASQKRVRRLFPTQPSLDWEKLQKQADYQSAKTRLLAADLISRP